MSEQPPLYCHEALLARLANLPRRPWEIGGWLLGYWSDGCVVITHATPPGRRGTPFGIHINADRHRALFDTAWEASAGRVTFLGDWHTHPGGPAIPSKRDLRALAFLAAEADFGTPEPLAAIVDLPRWPWSDRAPEIRVWLRRLEGEAGLVELELQPFHELPHRPASVPNWSWPRRGQR